jgi:hypothetical protein
MKVFIAGHADLDPERWHAQLLEQADKINDSLTKLAIKDLVDSVRTFEAKLALADTIVQQQLEQAIDTLAAYSERTLGRLSL